jgi:hypothetical protein
MWPTEELSDFHCVFIRVHKTKLEDNLPSKSAFSNTPKHLGNLSSDWCAYASAQTSRELIGRQKNNSGVFKNPLDFFIWRFKVHALRQLPDIPQAVTHEPWYNEPETDGEPNNRAHSIIVGDKPNTAEFKIKMRRAGEWAISP